MKTQKHNIAEDFAALQRLPQCVEIAEACLDSYWGREYLEEHFFGGSTFVYAEVSGGTGGSKKRVGGFMIFSEEEDVICLVGFAVHPECRRHGLARDMLKKIMEQSDRLGLPILVVVPQKNDVARSFLRAMGFDFVHAVSGTCNGVKDDFHTFWYEAVR